MLLAGRVGGGRVGSSSVTTGVAVFRRKRLFLRVHRRLPSTSTWYCLWGKQLTTVPEVFHLVGQFPCWFCMLTVSPISSGFSSVVAAYLWAF